MIKLALLWHMHQPYYEDLATGEHVLPWARLHALKDYVGMVSVLREFPGVRATFNLVPSLVVQVQAFAEDRAHDRHLEIGLKPAADLDEHERVQLIANGFHAPVERMIKPFAGYARLHAMRQDPDAFAEADLRDLQVWHKLAWIDPDWLRQDPRLVALIAKDHAFDEQDKLTLREVELELLRAFVPAYRDAATAGQVELSTSPFYHPILPLVCDTDAHLVAHPQSTLPRGLFRRPDDARVQLERAVSFHTDVFGARPKGVWPSEGSISDAVVPLLAQAGFAWAATDEEILARSLGRPLTADDLYRPYDVGDGPHRVRALFRDHALSDLIGFAYQSWSAGAAADDFVAKVREAGRRFAEAQSGGEDATVVVILDGENAWEHYVGGGRPFLRALYSRLAAAADIETVTMSEAASASARPLPHVFSGSWINGDFYIWAGHGDDHRAWTQLAAARALFDEMSPTVDAAARARAQEEILIAEGSDWFWWYGDDHSSDHDVVFDDLFRRHLRNVYSALGRQAPDDLRVSNITTATTAVNGSVLVTSFIEPIIDGHNTHFGEWFGAAVVPLAGAGGTMQRVAGSMVREVRVGVNRSAVLLRIEAPEFVRRQPEGWGMALLVDRPRRMRLDLLADRTGVGGGVHSGVGELIEVAIPFATLDAQAGDRLCLNLLIVEPGGEVVEQQPALHAIELAVPTRHLTALNWWV